jgi:hypothetical protein
MAPLNGKMGFPITLTGKGFTRKDNTVFFGDISIPHVDASADGTSLTFTVPFRRPRYACTDARSKCTETLLSHGHVTVDVLVVNANGKSNALQFTEK